MAIRWKSEDIIFDSINEADVWADSLGNEIYARLYDGYDTPDYKIAYSLAFRLASMKDFRVYAENDGDRYKVWVNFDN
ncbi:hypothetical protein ACIQXF_01775 [Lysinibacillus sp. NPDC097231]|uniref:hypothetical protein n=1 Tax=Lysinibacillus sp. NPDC097231 TaxID=3364142 RepID=UPI003815C0E3